MIELSYSPKFDLYSPLIYALRALGALSTKKYMNILSPVATLSFVAIGSEITMLSSAFSPAKSGHEPSTILPRSNESS